MLNYCIRRFLYAIILLSLMSIVSFAIIHLPPGDYVTSLVAQQSKGEYVSAEEIISMRRLYGLDRPMHIQYLKWVGNMMHGDFSQSFVYNRPVIDLIAERLPLTLAVAFLSLIFVYIIGINIGIYSATHQYSIGDYAFTAFGFVGISVPSFLIALVLMFVSFKYFGSHVGGVYSREYAIQSGWSWGKFLDLLKHLPLPVFVVGMLGMAWLVRIMRGCLLDELQKQYVLTARAKGQKEIILLYRYPVRVALNPIVSTIGWELTWAISGQTIVAIVMGLPTLGPLLLTSLLNQDMYVAGAIILFLSSLTIFGTFISDILLALVDPRIRVER